MPLPRNTHVHLAAAGDSAAGGAKPEPENFSREYVKELREESARYRTRAQDAEAKIKEAEQRAALAAQALVEAEAKVRAGDERLLLAELRGAALRAGMVDLDGLKLADLSTVTLSEAGEVEGAEALLHALKSATPYLFRAVSTCSTQPPPPREKPQQKSATEMSGAEWAAKKRELGL